MPLRVSRRKFLSLESECSYRTPQHDRGLFEGRRLKRAQAYYGVTENPEFVGPEPMENV